MSESLLIVLITSMGGTLLTVIGAIVQQSMTLKRTALEQQKTSKVASETKTITEESRDENKEGFNDLKALIHTQNTIIDLILRDRLRFLLQQYQDREYISYADKEIIVEMHDIYKAKGYNGTISKMFEHVDNLPVRS